MSKKLNDLTKMEIKSFILNNADLKLECAICGQESKNILYFICDKCNKTFNKDIKKEKIKTLNVFSLINSENYKIIEKFLENIIRDGTKISYSTIGIGYPLRTSFKIIGSETILNTLSETFKKMENIEITYDKKDNNKI
ncbi:MAG: hypothetical protein ACTSQG_00275 [Promethearchaeota archaeon]